MLSGVHNVRWRYTGAMKTGEIVWMTTPTVVPAVAPATIVTAIHVPVAAAVGRIPAERVTI